MKPLTPKPKPRLFSAIVNVIPLPPNPEYRVLAGALCHIWIKSKDLEFAEHLIVSYLRRNHWKLVAWDSPVVEIDTARLDRFDNETEQRYCRLALEFGVQCYFAGYDGQYRLN